MLRFPRRRAPWLTARYWLFNSLSGPRRRTGILYLPEQAPLAKIAGAQEISLRPGRFVFILP
jgi:hypothetical protein